MPCLSKSFWATSAFLLVATTTLGARATILTFNLDASNGTPAAQGSMLTLHPDYGNDVNSLTQTPTGKIYNYDVGNGFTSNIGISYSQDPAFAMNSGGMRYSTDGDASVPPLWKDVLHLWGGTTPLANQKFWFTFTPDATWGVRVNSFDMFKYGSATQFHNATWTLYQDFVGGTVLESSTTGSFNLPIDTPYTATTAGNVYFGTLVLEIHHTSGNGDFGLDNLNFDQVAFVPPPPVPEPSTFVLLGVGVGLTVSARRRSKR